MREEGESIKGEFDRLDGLRQNRIQSSEQFAYYTIPSVFPREETNDNTQAVGMLDSIGASVVNHFSNKLVTTLFSPNRPFFRMQPRSTDPAVKRLNDALEGDNPQEQAQAQAAFDNLRSKFVTVEKDAVRYLERIGYRTAATNAAKLLVVTGDVVIRSSKDNKPAVYSMRDYVAEKDLTGRDVVLIVRDALVYGALPADVQDKIDAANTETTYVASSPLEVFTRLELTRDGRYEVTQAVGALTLDGTNTVTDKESPFTHLSWNLSKGENYGRGLVEDYSGSFHMIDNLTRFQATMAAKMADLKIMVDPASGIDIEQLNNSETGTYVSGKPGDVQNLSSGMANGFAEMEGIIQVHKRQISAAFLFQAGQTRDAERVTAEEIQNNAAELEISHGGVYSRFAADWQTKAAYEALAASGTPAPNSVEPEIMTGMDSLSRTGEMQSVRVWMQDLTMTANIPDDVRAWLKPGKFVEYAAIQRGVDHGAFVMSEDEMKVAQEAAEQAEQKQLEAQAQQQQQVEAGKAVANQG